MIHLTLSGEHHPVYDEFGSILLLILAFRHHFCLQEADLGINYHDSFVRSFLRMGCTPRQSSELTANERQHLGGWAKGLYQAGHISDEFMATCSPKEFYLLVATLFDQSLRALQAGVLDTDTVKGGFECTPNTIPQPHHSH